MPRRKKAKVFVSYSRHDEALVKPLAGLLGVAAEDAVFLDVSSIKPGELWEEQIIGAVKEASVFVLCWCCESEHSTFIAKEISTALAEGSKRLVPVLFCSTPLPPTMADRQWIDLRGQVVHHCPIAHPAKPKKYDPASRKIARTRQVPPIEDLSYQDRGDEPEPDWSAPPVGAPPPSPAYGAPQAKPSPMIVASPYLRTEQTAARAAVPAPGPIAIIATLVVIAAALIFFGVQHAFPPGNTPAKTSTTVYPGETAPAPGPSETSPKVDQGAMTPPQSSGKMDIRHAWRQYGPDSLIVLGVFVSLGFLAWAISLLADRLQSMRRNKEHREADEIAAKAKSYFENLTQP